MWSYRVAEVNKNFETKSWSWSSSRPFQWIDQD
jgi:hypothetical protein